MLIEFKEFALKGNVVDMAVGISHAAAWREPGGVDFSNMFILLNGEHYGSLAQAKQAGAPTINFGLFINDVISFLIVAFALFIRGGQSYEPAEAQAGGRTHHRTATFTTGGDDSRDQGCARQRQRWRHWTGQTGENRTVD